MKNLQELEIDRSELEDILGLNIVDNLALEVSRVLILKNRQDVKSLIMTEIIIFFVSFLLYFPVILIVVRGIGLISGNVGGLVIIGITSLLLSTLSLLFFNRYLWQKAKKLKSLATILEKVDRYNNLIENIKTAIELNFVRDSNSKFAEDDLSSRTNSNLILESQKALKSTRESLIQSLEIEKIINRDRLIKSDGNFSLANLEDNLIECLSLSENRDNGEYGKLLTEAIEIGLSVHQEIRKIKS